MELRRSEGELRGSAATVDNEIGLESFRVGVIRGWVGLFELGLLGLGFLNYWG